MPNIFFLILHEAILIIKFRIELFLVGFPDGLLGKVMSVEEYGEGKYTLWDKIRYYILTGDKLND